MPRDLAHDLKHLRSLAFGRLKHCGHLLKRLHALPHEIASVPRISHGAKIDALPAPLTDQLWRIYDWLLVPFTLWPIDFEGFATHLLALLESSSSSFSSSSSKMSDSTVQPFNDSTSASPSPIQNQKSKIKIPPGLALLLSNLPEPPPAATQNAVAQFERDVETGGYDELLKQREKYDEAERALLNDEELMATWQNIKQNFDVTKYQNRRGVIRRRVSGERNFRENWNFDWSDERNQFQTIFDAMCYRWKLYGMEHDRPLLLKISVNPTPYGTMIFIPGHWSLDPRRDLDWSLINRLHRSRGAKKQGPKMSAGRVAKLDEAKKVKDLWKSAKKRGLKGESLHEFICTNMKRDILSDPSWWNDFFAKFFILHFAF